jgi:hypothetical protein
VSDVFREVDEAVRQDQLKQVWKRHGWLILGVTLAIVLGVGGWQAWKAYEADRRTEASDAYAQALQQARVGQVQPSLEALASLADPADGEVGTLAAFAQARVLAGQGQTAEAVAIWDRLAASDAAGPSFKAAALILSVQHQMGAGDPTQLAARLQPQLADGQPFRAAAIELTALLALEQGDKTRARELLDSLVTAEDASASLRDRAQQLLQAIGQ